MRWYVCSCGFVGEGYSYYLRRFSGKREAVLNVCGSDAVYALGGGHVLNVVIGLYW